MAHGIEMEPHARVKFEELSAHSVTLCGLFSDLEFPFLAATPGNILILKTFVKTYLINNFCFRRTN